LKDLNQESCYSNTPIVFVTNDQYLYGTMTCLSSIYKKYSSGKEKLSVFVIYDKDSLSEKSIEIFKKVFKDKENIDIKFTTSKFYENNKKSITEKRYKTSPEDDFRLSVPDFFLKVFIADALPKNYRKALFIDSDTFSVNSIEPLLNHKSDRPFSAAIDPHYVVIDSNLHTVSTYFNSGIFLIDLNYARKNEIENSLMESLDRSYFRLVDQDFLNLFYKNNFEALSPLVNIFLIDILFNDHGNKVSSLNKIKVSNILNKMIFLHFTGVIEKSKPWFFDFDKEFLEISGHEKFPDILRDYFSNLNLVSEYYFKETYFDFVNNNAVLLLTSSNLSRKEIDDKIKHLDSLYQKYLKRPLDPDGLISYFNMDSLEIARSIKKSKEYLLIRKA
jgi:lipopolysaccharide biosynthesis glycosyltransferase